jgi:ABC-type polysaccharide/polyol phosphate export permease
VSTSTQTKAGFWAAQREVLGRLDIAWTLASRELKGRYRGSWLGFLWTFAEPLILSGIFFLIFVVFFQQQTDYYLIYLLAGLLPFTFFSKAVGKSAVSIVSFGSLIRQIYCPRQVFVLVGIISELYHFVFALLVLIPFYAYYQVAPGASILALLPATLLLTVFSLGLGLLFGAMNVFVRDTNFFVTLLMRMWFYLSPIFYYVDRLDGVSPTLRTLYFCNPTVPILELFHWALVPGHPMPPLEFVALATLEALAAFVVGVWFFHRNDSAMVKML